MLEKLWFQLYPRFRVCVMRSLRQHLLNMGRLDLHASYTDKECEDWENAQLMGDEL